MKIQKKELNILLVVLGVAAAVAVYFLYFTKQQDKIKSMETEVTELQAQVAQLEKYDRDKETYIQRTKDDYDEIQAIVDKFPAEVREEDVILYSKKLEDDLDLDIASVSITPPTQIGEFGANDRQKFLSNSVVNISVTGTYENVKKMIDSIQTFEDRRNVSSITASYDSQTGNIAGSATLNLYSLAGLGQDYEEPDTGNISHGTQNIFDGQ